MFGAPHRFRFEESIEGEVADEVIGELFDLVRRTLGQQGEVTEALGTVEWKAQDAFGHSYVTVGRRGGRTTIGILSTRNDSLALAGTAAGVGAFFGSIGVGAALVSTGVLAGPLAAIAGVALASGSAWAAVRTVWRRYAGGVVARTESLGSMLVATARSALEEGRVRER